MAIFNFLIFFILSVNTTCSKKDGSYILNIQLHYDDITVMKILAMEKIKDLSKTDRQILIDYSNNILEEMNEDLKNFGVQLRGDYSFLLFEELDLKLQKKKLCMSKLMAIEATMRMLARLAYPNTKGMGLRIIALSCPVFDPVQIPFFTLPTGGCGNIGTLFVIEPFTLKTQIKFLIKTFISGGLGAISPIKSENYKKHLCNFANKCAVNNDLVGKFIENLKKVDFINDEEEKKRKIEIKKGIQEKEK